MLTTTTVDRLLDGNLTFAVCFCGRRLTDEFCVECGYELPRRRARRVAAELAEWKRRGRAATNRRLRQARIRAHRRDGTMR